MLELLGTVFSSIVAGGMTGILGVVVQRFFDMKNKTLDMQLIEKKHAHEVQMKRVDAEIMDKEFANRTQVANIEATSREAVADAQAFASSFNEPQRYSDSVKPSLGQAWLLVILDFIRGIVRPALTVYLCAVTTLIYLNAKATIDEYPMPHEDAVNLINTVVNTILYLCSTCVLWWFGTRNKQKAPGGLR